MRLALEQAELAFAKGEVPVGAVVALGGEIVAAAHNLRETTFDPTAHAETLALRAAALELRSWRLSDAALYVTKEPCIMCSGVMLNARLGRLVYGCSDPKGGAVRSLYHLLSDPRLNHRAEVVSGVLEEESAALLRRFFKGLREQGKESIKEVTAAVIEKDGRILIARRKEGMQCGGKWEFPGGKVEPGETPEACLRRELREEFGIEAGIDGFIAASEFDYGTIHIRLLAYRAHYCSGEFSLTDHAEVKWVARSELLQHDFADADIPIVKKLVESDETGGRPSIPGSWCVV